MILTFLLTLYAAGGAAVFWYVDRKEMKKEVPYGDMPALESLSVIRTTMLAVFMVIGTGVLIVLAVQAAVLECHIRLRYARRKYRLH